MSIAESLVQYRKNRIYEYSLFVFCILGGVLSLFFMFDYTARLRDEVYQSLCVRNYSEAPLGLFSFYIGHLWTNSFGFSLINLRFLAALGSVLAVGVTTAYSYRITHNLTLTGVSFLLGCVLMRASAFYLYNWDSGIYFFDSIALCLLISVISRPSTIKYILLGIVTALISSGRVPSVIILPLSIVIITIANRYNKSSYNSAVAGGIIFICWLITSVVIISLIMGSPSQYFSSVADGNVVSGHSPINNFKILFKRLTYISYFTGIRWMPGLGCIFLAWICPRIKRRWVEVVFITAWITYCLFYTFQSFIEDEGFPLCIGGDTPVGLGFLLAYPIYRLFRHRPIDHILSMKLWAVFILLISMSFGSDGYWERMITGFMVPVLIALLWKSKIKKLKVYTGYLAVISLVVFFSMNWFNFFNIKIKYDEMHISVSTIVPFQGIRFYQYDEAEIRNLQEAILYLRKNNIKYAPIGHHHDLQLVYGKDDALSFHEFYDDLFKKNEWRKHKEEILERVDAVVYPLNIPYIDYDEILEDLDKAGFNDSVQMGNAIIRFRSISQ